MSTADAPAPLDHLPLEVDGVPVRETLRALFSNPENGTPDNIRKAGCLALALKSTELGRAAPGHADESSKTHILWNAWREAFPSIKPDLIEDKWVNAVDFAGVDFRAHDIDFSLCHFGHAANFLGARWGDRANFFGACWGDRANFMRARWGDQAIFIKAKWGNDASFNGALWGSNAMFQEAQWGNTANFDGSQWCCEASFSRAQWGSEASFYHAAWGEMPKFFEAQWGRFSNFRGARWGASAEFAGARWGDHVTFRAAQWGHSANFVGAQWGIRANFRDAKWDGDVVFLGAQWGLIVDFSATTFRGDVDFSAKDWATIKDAYGEQFETVKVWAEERGMTPNTWCKASFQGAQFGGTARFTNRVFLAETDFGPLAHGYRDVVRDPTTGRAKWVDGKADIELLLEEHPRADRRTHFAKAPEFHGCTLHQNTSFDDAVFPKATGNPEAARAYRTLKLAFSKQQAVREEQRFFQHEMAEETLRETGIRRWLFRAYQSFSDFGFSVGRPLFGLILLPLPLFAAFYLWFATMANPDWNLAAITSDTLWHQWLRWWLTAALPVPGVDLARELRTELFGTGGVASLALLLEMIQKTLSLAGLFLAGLALRNLFKLK